MKIATWNVNSIRVREPRLLALLDRHSPDVLCLQETKVTDEVFPGEVVEAAGYRFVHRGQKAYNGVAILARHDIEEPALGFGDSVPPQLDEQARLIAATIKGVRVVCVYVPNGQAVGSEKYAYKLRWLDALRDYMAALCTAHESVLLCGDFNIAMEDRDVWDPRVYADSLMCTDVERAKLASIMELGLVDTLRLHREDEGLFSWWDYRRLAFPKGRGARIDHLYVTEALAKRCTETVIDRDERKGKQPSDHAPVFASFSD